MTDRRDHDADPGDHETDPADHDADLRDHDGPIPMITMHRSGRSRWADVRNLGFDGVRVVAKDMQPMCVVAGRVVPLPVVILHPDCTLSVDGDVGRLGVPRWW